MEWCFYVCGNYKSFMKVEFKFGIDLLILFWLFDKLNRRLLFGNNCIYYCILYFYVLVNKIDLFFVVFCLIRRIIIILWVGYIIYTNYRENKVFNVGLLF